MNHRGFVPIVLFVLLIVGQAAQLVAVPPSPQTQARQTVRLRVLVAWKPKPLADERSPIFGARINVWHQGDGGPLRPYSVTPPRAQEDTNNSGVAEIDVDVTDRPRALHVEVTHEKYSSGSIEIPIDRNGPAVIERTFILTPGLLNESAGRKIITLNVCAKDDGKAAVVGASVEIEGFGTPTTYQGVTDQKGCSVIAIPFFSENLTVRVQQIGYENGVVRRRVSDRDVNKTLDLSTTMKKLLGKTTAVVTVAVRDGNGNPIADADVSFLGTRSAFAAGYSKTTDGSGDATIVFGEYGEFEVRIAQDYYEPYRSKVTLPHGTERTRFEFELKPKPTAKAADSEEVTVRVVAGDKKDAPIQGAYVTVNGRSTLTDVAGEAVIKTSLGVAEAVTASASANGYKSGTQSLKILRSVLTATASARGTIILQPGEDALSESAPLAVILQVLDSGDNTGIPFLNYEVRSVEGAVAASGQTDFAGKREITAWTAPTETLRKGLSINLSGLKAHLPKINYTVTPDLLLPSNVARIITIYLDPTNQSFNLIPRDSDTQDRISRTKVRLLFDGTPIWSQEVAGNTIAVRLNDGPGVPIARIRALGLKAEVAAVGYATKVTDLQPSLLSPTATPTDIVVYLDNDWSELETKALALETKVTALRNDVADVRTRLERVSQRATDADAALNRARAVREVIEEAREPFLLRSANCQRAAELTIELRGYETDAQTQRREVTRLLAEASSAAASCSTPAQAAEIRRKYQDAIRTVGRLGTLEKQALSRAQTLVTLKALGGDNASGLDPAAQMALAESIARSLPPNPRFDGRVKSIADLLRILDSMVAEIETEATTAARLEAAAEIDYRRAVELAVNVPSRQAELARELTKLQNDWELLYDVKGHYHVERVLPSALQKRLDGTAMSLRTEQSAYVLNEALVLSIRRFRASVQKELDSARETVAKYKSSGCAVGTTEVLENIGSLVIEAGVELRIGAEVLNRADACEKRGACQPILDPFRELLEAGDLRKAGSLLDQARAMKCDVGSEEDELDYFTTLFDTRRVLQNAMAQCQFKDAAAIAEKIPQSFRQRSQISSLMVDIARGAGAEEAVSRYLTEAIDAGDRGLEAEGAGRCDDANRRFALADGAFGQAYAAAGTLACLRTRIDNTRADLTGRRKGCASAPPPPIRTPPIDVAPPGLGEKTPIDRVPPGLGEKPPPTRETPPNPPAPPPPPPPIPDPVPVLSATLDCGPILEVRVGQSRICDVIVKGWNSRTTTPVRLQVTPNPLWPGVTANPGDTQSDPTTMNSTAATAYADRYVFQQGFSATTRATPGSSMPVRVTVSQGGSRIDLPLTVNVIASNAPDGSSMFPVGPVRQGTGGSVCVFRFKTFGDPPECWSFQSGSCADSRYGDGRFERVGENLTRSEASALEIEMSRYYGDNYACNAVQGGSRREPIPPPVLAAGNGGGYCTWRYKLFGDAPRCFHVAVAPCGRYGPPYELIGTNMSFSEASARGDQVSRFFDDELGCRASQRPPPPGPPRTPDDPAPPGPPPVPPAPPAPPEPPRPPARTLTRFGIDPRDVTIAAGDSVSLRAFGVWSDAPNQAVELTNQVQWSMGPQILTAAADAGRRFVVTATHPMGSDSVTITVAANVPGPPVDRAPDGLGDRNPPRQPGDRRPVDTVPGGMGGNTGGNTGGTTGGNTGGNPGGTTGPPPAPPDPSLERLNGTWYFSGYGGCYTMAFSISGFKVTGASVFSGDFLDSGSFQGEGKGGALYGTWTSSYNNQGCTSCKAKSGARTGTFTASYNVQDQTMSWSVDEDEKSAIFPGRSFSSSWTRKVCK